MTPNSGGVGKVILWPAALWIGVFKMFLFKFYDYNLHDAIRYY